MTKEERRTCWKRLPDEQVQSALTAPNFCRENNLKLSQFNRWRWTFESQTPMRSSDGFIELIPSSKYAGSGIRIRVFHLLSIEVERGFDPISLRAVIHKLYSGGEQTCSHRLPPPTFTCTVYPVT